MDESPLLPAAGARFQTMMGNQAVPPVAGAEGVEQHERQVEIKTGQVDALPASRGP